MVKSTVCARSGVIDMPPMMTSNLPARRAGMMPLQAVGWKSTLTPRSSATFFATSISKSDELAALRAHGPGHEGGVADDKRASFLDRIDEPVLCGGRRCGPEHKHDRRKPSGDRSNHVPLPCLPPAYRLRLNRASTNPAANDNVTVRAR